MHDYYAQSRRSILKMAALAIMSFLARGCDSWFYSLIEEAYGIHTPPNIIHAHHVLSAASHFNTKGFEPIIPKQRDLEQKQAIYRWSESQADSYPPHLQRVPPKLHEGAAGVWSLLDLNARKLIGSVAQKLSL